MREKSFPKTGSKDIKILCSWDVHSARDPPLLTVGAVAPPTAGVAGVAEVAFVITTMPLRIRSLDMHLLVTPEMRATSQLVERAFIIVPG